MLLFTLLFFLFRSQINCHWSLALLVICFGSVASPIPLGFGFSFFKRHTKIENEFISTGLSSYLTEYSSFLSQSVCSSLTAIFVYSDIKYCSSLRKPGALGAKWTQRSSEGITCLPVVEYTVLLVSHLKQQPLCNHPFGAMSAFQATVETLLEISVQQGGHPCLLIRTFCSQEVFIS